MLRRWRSDEGAELIEFALVVPMLLFLLAGIAEFGIIFQQYEVVTNAAREGARIAVLPGYSTADVQTRVGAYLTAAAVPVATSGTPSTSLVNVGVTNGTVPISGGRVINVRTVTVVYTHQYLFLRGIGAWFGNNFTTLPLTAAASMRLETAP